MFLIISVVRSFPSCVSPLKKLTEKLFQHRPVRLTNFPSQPLKQQTYGYERCFWTCLNKKHVLKPFTSTKPNIKSATNLPIFTLIAETLNSSRLLCCCFFYPWIFFHWPWTGNELGLKFSVVNQGNWKTQCFFFPQVQSSWNL